MPVTRERLGFGRFQQEQPANPDAFGYVPDGKVKVWNRMLCVFCYRAFRARFFVGFL